MSGSAAEPVLQAVENRLAPEKENRQTFVRLRSAAAARAADSGGVALVDETGRKSWYRVSVLPAGDRDSSLWMLAVDEERNALAAAIAAEQERMVRFLEDCPIGYFSVDESGKFLSANTAFSHWVGLTDSDLVEGKKRLHDFLSGEQDGGLPPWSALGSETANVGEVELLHVNGRRFSAFVAETMVLDGDRVRTRTLVRDLSRERDTRSALRQSEERFHRFFDEAPVGIALLDSDGLITECSSALVRLSMPEQVSLSGMALWDIAIDDDRDRIRQWVANAIVSGDETPIQVTLKGDDQVVASLFAQRLESDAGGPGGACRTRTRSD